MEAKEIDICICFYNTPLNYFKECLDSIINQTNKNFNLILLNDGSTNIDIEEYLNNEILNKNFGFDIFYHKQKNKQLFFSRIEILKFTVSKYVYFFDFQSFNISSNVLIPLFSLFHFCLSQYGIINGIVLPYPA